MYAYKFKNINEKLNEHFNIVTEEDSEAMLKEYKSYLQSTSKSNIIIIDPINNILLNIITIPYSLFCTAVAHESSKFTV